MKLNKEKIIFLVILLFVVLTVISSKNDNTIIRINDDNACIRSNVYSNDNPYSVQFCNKNKVEIEYTGKDFDDKKTYLKIHNVVDFYTFYDVLKDEASYYMIKKDGTLYKTTSTKITKKDYSVEKLKNYNDIVSLKELYINGEYNVYAISKKGKIKQV